MALPNGDLVTTVFNPQMAYPLDKRMQIDTLNSRDSMSMFIRWEGMEVYVLENSTKYILQGGISNEYWKELGTGSGGSGGSTFVGQFPTVEDLPTTGRSPGNYAFVGTDDNFSQYNWDNIAGRWVKNELKLPVGAEGQILKVKENGSSEYIVADPLVFGNFITNDEELEDAKSYIVTPSEVFNSWFRFSHGVGYGGSDTSYIVKSDLVPGMPLQTNSWLYDSGNDVVRSTMNASSFLGFVNNDNVTYYNLSTTISASGSDSDRVGVVLCFIEDKTDMIGNNAYGMDEGDFYWDIDVENELIPNQHTLTVFRNRKYVGNGIPPYDYFVVYNYGKLDEKIIAVNTDPWRGSTTSFAWDGNSFDISIVRAGDQISILVSDFSDAPGGKGSLRFPINIDLSSDPDLYKFRGGARFGVCCQSQQNTSFSELNFSNSDNDILDLRNGNVWVLDGSEHVISPDRNVYNEVPAKSYFYSRRYGTFGFINSAIGDYLILNRDISQQEVHALSLEFVNHISIPYGSPQIITRSTGDEALIREIGNVVFDKNTNLWVLTYTGTRTPYVEDECWVYWATSPDLKTWTKKGKCTDQGAEDPYLVIQGGTYYLFVEHKDLDHPTGHAGVGLWKGTSMETLTFQGVVLEASESGWDSGDVSSPTIIYDDNTWYMFYEGRQDPIDNQRGAIGLATSPTLDGEWVKVTENDPLVAGTQYDANSPVQWAYSIVPDDILKIGERYYLSFHAESNNSYVTSIIASESLTDGWFDLIGTWFTKDITGQDVNGAGFMFVKTDGKIRTIANQGTGIYLCDLTNKSIDNWYYRTVPASASEIGLHAIAGGNRNEVIKMDFTSNKSFGWRSNKAGKAGIIKKIINASSSYTISITPDSGVRINNSTSTYVIPANTTVDFLLTSVDRWETIMVYSPSSTPTGIDNFAGHYSNYSALVAADVGAEDKFATTGTGDNFTVYHWDDGEGEWVKGTTDLSSQDFQIGTGGDIEINWESTNNPYKDFILPKYLRTGTSNNYSISVSGTTPFLLFESDFDWLQAYYTKGFRIIKIKVWGFYTNGDDSVLTFKPYSGNSSGTAGVGVESGTASTFCLDVHIDIYSDTQARAVLQAVVTGATTETETKYALNFSTFDRSFNSDIGINIEGSFNISSGSNSISIRSYDVTIH